MGGGEVPTGLVIKTQTRLGTYEAPWAVTGALGWYWKISGILSKNLSALFGLVIWPGQNGMF